MIINKLGIDMDEQLIIKNAVESARKWLPNQAPISKFVHHNTLHNFEDMPFEDAVEFVSSIRKTNSYKLHMEYLQDYKNKRISADDIDFVVAEFCQKEIGKNNDKINLKSLTVFDFYRSLLMVPESSETDASLLWLAEEGLKKYFYEFSSYSTKNRFISKTKEVIDKIIEKEDMKTIIQYLTCNATAEGQRACFFDEYQVRGSDGLLALYSTSIEEFSLKFLWITLQKKICWKYRKNRSKKENNNNSLNGYSKVVDEKLRYSLDQFMIRLMAAFLDDGLSFWPMPDRDQGFLSVFLKLAEFGDRFLPDFAKWFPDDLKVSIYENKSNYEIINDILFSFDIPKNNWNEYICRELLFLSGWSGTASLIEKKPELMHNFSIKSELADVLAVRLILKKNLLEHQYKSNFTNDQENYSKSDFVSTMLQVFRFMQVAGISACEVIEMSQEEFNALMTRILGFNDVARRRLLHLSYERHYYRGILDSVAINQKYNREFYSSKECKIQAVFCIDDREESLRRHLEEISENIETYAVAGFYNIDMYYQSVNADKPSPLCPGSMTPEYKVIERLSEGSKEKNDRLVKQMQHSLYYGSKKIVLGHITSLIGGYLTILPLMFRVLAPRVAKRFLANLGKIANISQKTELLIERSQYKPDLSEETLKLGYTVNEMVDRVHSILCAIGLVKDFSPLVFIIGHGSNSYNNPHESAHDCGACGGQRGGPNARVFAMMANRSDVREKLERLGINIPNSVLFVGGYHDTCSDEITLLI
ncbi:MAG: putative inorganic carbon transporter subunit DabA [Bdellovibrionota bacterium]